MLDRDTQDLLRRIVLPPETAAALPKGKDRPRIPARTGSYYFDKDPNGQDADDKNDEDEEDGKGEEGEDGKGGGTGDPRKDPTETPKVGEDIPGLTGLHDCDSGRCVNVNFTIPPQPPEGWPSVCEPPKSSQAPQPPQLFKVVLTNSHKKTSETKYFDSRTAAVAAVRHFIPGGYTEETSGTFVEKDVGHVFIFPLKDDVAFNGYLNGFNSGYYQRGVSYSVIIWKVTRSGWFKDRSQAGHLAFDISMQTRTDSVYKEFYEGWQAQNPPIWPPETCAEIESKSGGFKAACEESDPNLPLALKGEYSAFQLCDKNGNPVTVERFGSGWRYTTDKWEVTISGSGTVQSVRPVY